MEQRGETVDSLTEDLDEKMNSDEKRDLTAKRAESAKAIEKSPKYNEARHRAKCKPAKTYNVGEYVVIRNVDTVVGTNKKLIPRYRGLYVVHRILGNDRYVVRDVENC